MTLLRQETDTTRKWNDYSLVKTPFDGGQYIKQYIERFSTVSYFNEFAVRWSNCEQFYLQIDNLPLFIYWIIIAVILSDRR